MPKAPSKAGASTVPHREQRVLHEPQHGRPPEVPQPHAAVLGRHHQRAVVLGRRGQAHHGGALVADLGVMGLRVKVGAENKGRRVTLA